MASSLSKSNPEEALRLMKKALTIYEQHPDDERRSSTKEDACPLGDDRRRLPEQEGKNYVNLLDYAGTYAAQVAFNKEGPYDEALDFIHRAYDIAKNNQMTDLMCQTLTSLANVAWAKEDYRQAIDYAHQAESLLSPSGEDTGGLADLRPGVLQVLARSYLSLNMLDSAETVYRQMEPGNDVHLAYIVQSNLAKIALRRMGATQVEDDIDDAFDQVEDFYFKALEQKDEYYQETLRQEMENQQLEYRTKMYGRTLHTVIIAAVIVILAIVLVVRYRMRAQRQEKLQLQQEAEHQRALLHQANEVVAFLQNFILERTEVMKKLNQSGDSLIYLSPHEWSEIERTLNAIDNERLVDILPDNVWVAPYSTNPDNVDGCTCGEVMECSPYLKFRWRESDTNLEERGEEPQWYEVQTQLIGAYNIDNLLAAIAVGLNFAVEPADINEALASYVPSNNRSQLTVTEKNRLIVDAYNANPSSMRAALENFALVDDKPKMAILGDMRELGNSSRKEHEKIVDLLRQMELDQVWLVGDEFAAIDSPEFRKFHDVGEVKTVLTNEPPQGYCILIKGSNSTKLYQLPELL